MPTITCPASESSSVPNIWYVPCEICCVQLGVMQMLNKVRPGLQVNRAGSPALVVPTLRRKAPCVPHQAPLVMMQPCTSMAPLTWKSSSILKRKPLILHLQCFCWGKLTGSPFPLPPLFFFSPTRPLMSFHLPTKTCLKMWCYDLCM